MKEREDPRSRPQEAARGAEAFQREAASVLYGRLISPGGPANVPAIASLLGVTQSTVYRQCSGDIPVQLRTLVALGRLDYEGLKLLLDTLGRMLGIEWRWDPEVDRAPAVGDLFAAVAEVSLVCSEAAVQELETLRDGCVTAEELRELERLWTEEDYKRERMRAHIRALALKPGTTQG